MHKINMSTASLNSNYWTEKLHAIMTSLSDLKTNVKELYLPKEVPELNSIPEPLEFYRGWVAPNIPFVVRGGIKDWPAVKKWNREYFLKNFKEKLVTVAVTPNGYADAVTEAIVNEKNVKCFVLPEERIIKFTDFLYKLSNEEACLDEKVKDSKGVFYIQKQNSNLTEEFPELLGDIDENLLWASQAFNSKPAAINLWIGDERAVSSLHKDPFENIYCVVSGFKDFILLAPTDRPWLPYKRFPIGQYYEISPGHFEIQLLNTSKWMSCDESDDRISCAERMHEKINERNNSDVVPWIDIDPVNPDIETYPEYKNATPLSVRIEAGDVLYLPSLWYHHVRQSNDCIAVNFWYDMNFDIKYAYYQFLESISDNVDKL